MLFYIQVCMLFYILYAVIAMLFIFFYDSLDENDTVLQADCEIDIPVSTHVKASILDQGQCSYVDKPELTPSIPIIEPLNSSQFSVPVLSTSQPSPDSIVLLHSCDSHEKNQVFN